MSQQNDSFTLETLEERYSEKSSKSQQVVFDKLYVSMATLRGAKPKNEDRAVVFPCPHGLLVAVFDGHFSDELSEYASETLPRLLCHRIADNLKQATTPYEVSKAVTSALVKGVEEFDRSLIQAVLDLFPEKDQTDWSKWTDRADVHGAIGYSTEDASFRSTRRAVTGSTALIGFLDKEGKNLWIASLGDSEAVGGYMTPDGTGRGKSLNDLHNCKNKKEVERIHAEHPGETGLIVYARVLGVLAITRTLGDHQLKVPITLAANVLAYGYPSPITLSSLERWAITNTTPPYLSSTPTIHHHVLTPGDVLVFASDGLRDAFWNAQKLKFDDPATRASFFVSLAGAGRGDDLKAWSEKLGHKFIALQEGDNVAERVIKNALFGTDLRKMAADVERDDISVVVVKL